MRARYSILERVDMVGSQPTYYQVWCNGCFIGNSQSQQGAERIIKDYKKNLRGRIPGIIYQDAGAGGSTKS